MLTKSLATIVIVLAPYILPMAAVHVRPRGYALWAGSASTAQEGSTPALAVAVDGRVTPERISDELAYRHFLRAVGGHATGSIAELSARRALLNNVGLGEADLKKVLAASQTVKDILDGNNASRGRWSIGAPGAMVALENINKTETRDLDDRASALRASVSPEGAARLHAYITEHVKRHIKIYGELPVM